MVQNCANQAVWMAAVYFVWPNEGLELLCYVFEVFVRVVNMLKWLEAEILEKVQGKG
jgi:hypothetical protein